MVFILVKNKSVYLQWITKNVQISQESQVGMPLSASQ